MKYLKIALCVLAAVFLAEFIPSMWWMFHNVNSEKATGMAVVLAGFLESLVSPIFWVLAVPFFFLFLRTSRMSNAALRVVLFWIPTIFCSLVSLLFAGTLAYLFFHFRQHP